jgi:tetratricopeptide (TPR) repeat protein
MKRITAGGLQSAPSTGPKRRPVSVGRSRFHVGVLPFLPDHASRDEDLAFSISQKVATALARCRWLDVVPPRSVADRSTTALMSEKGARGQELDYLVEGAVSRDGKRVQISVRLLDLGECARTAWSDSVVLAVGQLQEWSELVATRIAGGIDPVVFFLDGQPQRSGRAGARDLLRLAIPLMYSMERRKYEAAGKLLNRALQLEPDNGTAVAWAGYWQVFHVGQGWAHDIAVASGIAQVRASTAIKLNPDNAETLIICAHICSFLNRDYDTALYYFDRAQRLDPSVEFPWLWSALTYCYVGKLGHALERLKRYRDLASLDPLHLASQSISSVAYACVGDYAKAVEFGRRAIKMNPAFVNGYKPLIASLGHLGRGEEAKPYVDKLLALEPNFTVERFGQVYPIKYDGDREHYMKGLRLAGVPER